MLKDADITESKSYSYLETRIVCQTALSFFRVLAQSQFDNPVSGLKIFRDFPEYDKNIYEVIKNEYPQFAWLLAMKLSFSMNGFLLLTAICGQIKAPSF